MCLSSKKENHRTNFREARFSQGHHITNCSFVYILKEDLLQWYWENDKNNSITTMGGSSFVLQGKEKSYYEE